MLAIAVIRNALSLMFIETSFVQRA